jgi:hypothetical protein
MTSLDPLARQALVAGSLLLVSGLAAVVIRRRLVVNFLGLYLSLIGGAVLSTHSGSRQNGRTAAVLFVASLVVAPVALAGIARWRHAGGRSDQTELMADEESTQ